MYTNNTKSNNTQTTFQLRQARGGNMYNHLPEEAEAIVNRIGAPIIGFIDRKVDGKLPKVNCCEVYGAKSHWLFTLAKGAEECREGVPYIFVIENVRFNRDDTPSLMVHPVKELSPELLRNERFGNLLAKSARFPLQWPNDRPRTWNYEPLCKHFNLPVDTAEIDLCKHAVDQALAGKISFEEVVELIHLPVDIAGSYGGAAAVKPGNFRAEDSPPVRTSPSASALARARSTRSPDRRALLPPVAPKRAAVARTSPRTMVARARRVNNLSPTCCHATNSETLPLMGAFFYTAYSFRFLIVTASGHNMMSAHWNNLYCGSRIYLLPVAVTIYGTPYSSLISIICAVCDISAKL